MGTQPLFEARALGTDALAAAARLGRFWALAPAAKVYAGPLRALAAAWTVALRLALLAGLCRRSLWRWPRVAAPACLIALSAVHALYWTDLRMRAPVVPALALVPAWGLCPRPKKRGSEARQHATGP
jgi:hypothetical protein